MRQIGLKTKASKYSAPELLLEPGADRVDASVDVYSLGVIVYEMFSGKEFPAGPGLPKVSELLIESLGVRGTAVMKTRVCSSQSQFILLVKRQTIKCLEKEANWFPSHATACCFTLRVARL